MIDPITDIEKKTASCIRSLTSIGSLLSPAAPYPPKGIAMRE
jgi:hypothetical protein